GARSGDGLAERRVRRPPGHGLRFPPGRLGSLDLDLGAERDRSHDDRDRQPARDERGAARGGTARPHSDADPRPRRRARRLPAATVLRPQPEWGRGVADRAVHGAVRQPEADAMTSSPRACMLAVVLTALVAVPASDRPTPLA